MENFNKQFCKVFNVEGSVKNCGREETKKMIEICQNIMPNKNFGNMNTGIMNVEEILKLREMYND